MNHNDYMRSAFLLAQNAMENGEIPVGAVVVMDGNIVGSGNNRQLRDSDPSAHAEIVALRAAGKTQKNFRLDGAIMYVTIQPCDMCQEAIKRARVSKVYYASYKAVPATHVTIFEGLDAYGEESCEIMKGFFKGKR